jgi:N-acetylmuramoyl-L-alanine amidase
VLLHRCRLRSGAVRIEAHRLVDSDPNDGIEVAWIPDETAGPLVPEIAVIHYAVTQTARATANVLNAREYCSCHVTIDSTGRVIQQVPFNRVAWHAGTSLYKGRPSVSKFSLGIEISNPGPLERKAAGEFVTTYGAPWKGGVIEAYHPNTPGRGWSFWAEYSQTELDLCAHLCELWRQEYGITDIVGHDEIAPGRKFDPGPAFPMDWLRRTIFPSLYKDTDPAELLPPDELEPTVPDVGKL